MKTSREFILDSEYVCYVDTLSENEWNSMITKFRDATINQTWAWSNIMSPKTSNLVIRRNGSVVAAAILRLVTIPVINAGIAYIGTGPMWRLYGEEDNINILRHLIRALRKEYVDHRGLLLRITPNIFNNYSEYENIITVFEKEHFKRKDLNERTLFLDLNQPLEHLRKSLHTKWRGSLNNAEKNNMIIYKGNDEKTFITFRGIYKEMVLRKKYDEPADIDKYENIFKVLPDSLKPIIIICESEGIPAAGVVMSTLGETAIPWLLASGNKGRQSNAAYLVQWELIKWLKDLGFTKYDLGGCNPEKVPQTYLFKARMCGKDPTIYKSIGIMDACENPFSTIVVNSGMYIQKLSSLFKKLILGGEKFII